MEKNYPELHQRLRELIRELRKELPGPMSGFRELYESALTEGELSPRVKQLIALAIAVAVRCDGCIADHVRGALRAGATRAEVVEAIGVAVLMGGGPSVIYGSEALEALAQFEKEAVAA